MESIEIYKSPDGVSLVEVKFEEETVWLSQQQMATLFEQTKQNISLHIKNCFNEGELDRQATVKEYLTVQKDLRVPFKQLFRLLMGNISMEVSKNKPQIFCVLL